MNRILPIGSVVLIKNGTKPVMIFGYLQNAIANKDDIVDYVGVPYPEGNLNVLMQFGFQMTDIREVLFEGYRTEEFKPWEDLLKLAEARHTESEDNSTEE